MSLNSFRNGMGHLGDHPVAKWALFAVGGVLVFSLVYSGLGNNLGGGAGAGGARAGGPSGADTVATVNGQPITRAQFDQTLDNLRQQAQMMGGQTMGPSQMPLLINDALNQVATANLALQRAEKMGFTASSSEIAQARQQAIQQSGIAAKLGLPASASVTDINNALAKVNSSLDQFFSDDSLKNSVIMQKLQASFNKPVTEQDARESFRQWHTRHILIDNHKVSDVQAQSKAQQILAKALAPGADFAALANQYTDDPGNKDRTGKLHGGDDGWIDQNTGYVPEFKNAAFALNKGQITPQPVKSQFGYFIIKAQDTRDNLPKDFDKNKAKYIAQVQQQRQQTAQQAFLAQINGDPNNKIVVTDPGLKGEQELAQAQQGDPAQRPAKLNAAVADLTNALKGASFGQAGELNAALAQAYQGLNQPQKAIAPLKAAVDATPEDQDLEMALGQLYVQTKDPKDAIAQFQVVSKQAWNDPQVHQNLKFVYTSMKRPDLAAQENTLAQQIQKRQRQAGASPLGGMSLGAPGGTAPVAVSPSAPGSPPVPHSVTVKPAVGQPAPPAPKPGQ